jgi:hypothetical protein
MARLIKTVRVRGNLEAKVQGGLDGKLLIFREGNDLILRVELVSFEGSSYPGFVRIKYDNIPLSDIDNVITRYLATNPRNFKVIQDPFDPNVIPFQEITPEPPTPVSTPQQIEQTRQEEAVVRQQTQETTQLQQIPESVIENSTPEQVKPKGKNRLGQRILNLGNQILKLIIPKLEALILEYVSNEFNQAREEAISQGGEVLAQAKAQYCPAPATLNQLIETRNNIVDQLNGIGNRLNLANQTVNGLTTSTNTSQDIINLASLTQTGLNLAASTGILPAPTLGPILSNYNSIEKIIQTVSPLISSNNNALYATSIPLGVVSFVVTKATELLNTLDILIDFCSIDSPLTPVSDTIQQVTIRQVQANINSGSYNGFIFKIEEVPFSPTVTRRKAVAFNQSGIALLETPLSFTTNEQTLINELKLIIDRDNLRSY